MRGLYQRAKELFALGALARFIMMLCETAAVGPERSQDSSASLLRGKRGCASVAISSLILRTAVPMILKALLLGSDSP
jgi:hypothetical protein